MTAPAKLSPSQASMKSRKARLAAMTPEELAAWRAYQSEASIRSQRKKAILKQLEELCNQD
ncbi:hypothetical protein QTH91_05930 [Variovorax dokdonensis]|uniref:Uncharacterized protein n=1 Tax=Variovorax dokdonensis TaxID=344883 RepID=A0ABT7N7W0_9BURK|nr:hypothetical protein [Variovorax dokdonensis]MDM0044013.1 hypothetical protein [Variovorax dokdonensis]